MMLAHQGGWDEMLLVAVPIVALAALLWLANRRADALRRHADTETAPEATAGGPEADRTA